VDNSPNDNPDWEQGYGFQFWRCRHNAVRGAGAFGQYCILMPDQDAVLAITSGIQDMQTVLDLVWKHLLPAMGPVALSADPAKQTELKEILSSLAIRPQQGEPSSPLASRFTGKTYRLDRNEQNVEWLRFDFRERGCTIVSREAGVEQTISCGQGCWRRGTFVDPRGTKRNYVASGAWISEDAYRVQLVLYETPFCPAITARFTGDRLTYEFEANVSFGPAAQPALEGRVTSG
jgi:hypothetical protein